MENYRNKGIATQLLQHCELWSKENACTEFASDCEISNAESYVFHMKFGFQEANRIICFKKDITLQSQKSLEDKSTQNTNDCTFSV